MDLSGTPNRPRPGAEAPAALVQGRKIRPVPLYERVRAEVTELILSGDWPRGAAIPGEARLAEQFGISVGTVRRALGDLVAEGLLLRRPRVGTVVSDRSPHHSMRFLFHYFRLHRATGELVLSDAKVLSVEPGTASDEERAMLKLQSGDGVIRVVRVRLIDDAPVMHERIVLPAARFPDFPSAAELPNRPYLFFQERYGIRLASARESLRADIASPEDCALLDLEPGQAVLEIDRISYDAANTIVERRLSRATTEGYRYINEVR